MAATWWLLPQSHEAHRTYGLCVVIQRATLQDSWNLLVRIAYLSASEIPSRAANSVHVMKMCAAFASAGHEVDLYAREGASWGRSPYELYGVRENFRIIYCARPPLRWLGGVLYARNVRRKMAAGAGAYDLVYARHLYSLMALARYPAELVFESHVAPQRWVQRKFETRLFSLPSFARLVTISQVLADDYLKMFPDLAPERIVVAHDGADEPETSPAKVCGEGRIRAGYIGQLYAGKGMEIISQLPTRLPGVDFHVTGGTNSDIQTWQSRLTAPNLYFHGYVPHSEVGRHIDDSDIVVAPYQERVSVHGTKRDVARWMSPLKIFEYMARGRAIVCSDLPVLREILSDGIDAILVHPNDIDGWVAAIRNLANDVQLRIRLGAQARQKFLKMFTWGARAQRVLEGLR